MPDANELDAIVVGAGFCGTAATAALRRYGVERTQLLEAGDCFGNFWVGNYDRIQLHTAWHDLPDDGGLSDEYPMYKSRSDLLDYFARYASRHALREATHFGEPVTSLRRDSGDADRPWRVETAQGTYHSRFAVVCTGQARMPHVPAIPGRERFGGALLHSREFRNGSAFAGQRVLVAGSGNSACEQAMDLVEHGAEVTLLVYGPRHMAPIDRVAEFAIESRKAGRGGPEGVLAVHPLTAGTAGYAEVVTQIDEALLPLTEDMSSFGIQAPALGPYGEYIRHWRVFVMDQGAIPLIRKREIEVVRDRIERFTERGVYLREAGARDFDAVVLATGFRPGLHVFLDEAELAALDPDAGMWFPKTDKRCRSTVFPDLFFIGYDTTVVGGTSHGHWGFEVAEKIATELGTFHEAMRPPEYKRSPWLPA